MEKSSHKKQPAGKNSKKSAKGPWIFMVVSLFLFLLVFLFDHQKGTEVAVQLYRLIVEIFPVFFLIFVLMILINLFLKTSLLVKYMGEKSGIKGWLVAIVTGILSMGAIYMWFPLLKEMMEKGVKPGLISVFLYNRGIKLHFLPLMAFYFGLKYVVILTIVTVLISVLQGLSIDFFLSKKKREK